MTVSAILSMQIMSPSLPDIATGFGTSPGTAQLVLIVFPLSYFVFQLIYGPVSDRRGRRGPMLVGLVLYAVASVAGGFATSIETLIVARVFQAIGSCAIFVLGNN